MVAWTAPMPPARSSSSRSRSQLEYCSPSMTVSLARLSFALVTLSALLARGDSDNRVAVRGTQGAAKGVSDGGAVAYSRHPFRRRRGHDRGKCERSRSWRHGGFPAAGGQAHHSGKLGFPALQPLELPEHP